ncbi:MAG: hypothetical protein WA116_06335 [Anaerolineaceae bacterium]
MTSDRPLLGNTKNLKQTDVNLIVLFIFVLGLVIRLVGLGKAPFSVDEATFASRAWEVARLKPVEPISNAAYLGLTSITFFLLDASAFWARFWPALVGSSLTLLPIVWHKRVSTFSTIGIALALALDPVLVSVSRQADGPIFALVGLVWGIVLLHDRHKTLAGVSFAIGLLGGPWFWIGLLILLLSWGIAKVLDINVSVSDENYTETAFKENKEWLGKVLLGFIPTLLLVGSAFSLNPTGLSGIASGLVSFFTNLFEKQNLPFRVPIYQYVAYSILPIVLGVFASIRLWKSGLSKDKLLVLAAWISFVLSLFFSGQGSGGIAMALVPLWILAVDELGHFFEEAPDNKTVSLWMMIFSLVVLIYLGISVSAFMESYFGTPAGTQQGLTSLAGIALLILSFILVGLGWSFKAARQGLLTAVLIYLSITSISLTFSCTGIRAEAHALQWAQSPVMSGEDNIVQILNEFERQGTLETDAATVAIIADHAEGLEWTFKDFGKVLNVSGLGDGFTPEVVLTETSEEPSSGTAYRGMNVTTYQEADWRNMSFLEAVKSLFTRDLKTTRVFQTLWIRQDLFTGVDIP